MTAAPRLLLRADAGPVVGAGHVMRCLALAEAWIARGGRATWLAAAGLESLAERVAASGVEARALGAPAGGVADAEATLDAAGQLGAAWVVLDGYHLGSELRARVTAGPAPVLVVDDNAIAPPCDAALLLDQNVQASAATYAGYGPRTRRLLGSRYALLRGEFLRRRGPVRAAPEACRRVLVTFGGGDALDLTGLSLQALERAVGPGTSVVAVVGPANPHVQRLRALAAGAARAVEVVVAEPDMARRMAEADLALTAGGTTLWELAFLGVPALAVVVADNQAASVAEMARRGAVVALGEAGGVTAEGLAAAVAALASDRSRRDALAAAGRTLIDGLGAGRVVSAMMEPSTMEREEPREGHDGPPA